MSADHARPILAALRAEGLDATYEMTGGGCGTIFVGPMVTYSGSLYASDNGERYSAALGPFDYRSGDAEDLLFVGVDDCGESTPFMIPPSDVPTIVGAVKRLVEIQR